MPRNRFLLVIIPIAIVATILAAMNAFPLFTLGERFIITRYVEQFRAGNGLVFNPGERVLLLPFPAYLLSLGLLAILIPGVTVLGVSAILFFVALLIGGFSVYRIMLRLALSEGAAFLGATLYCLSAPILARLGTPFPLASALCLLSIDLALQNKWTETGIAVALGTLVHPDALLLVIPLLIYAIRENQWRKFTPAMLMVLMLAVIGLVAYYGSGLKGLLILRTAQTAPLNIVSVLLLVPLAFASWGWYQHRENPIIGLLGLWAALHILVVLSLLHYTDLAELSFLVGPVLIIAIIGIKATGIRPYALYSTIAGASLLATMLGVILFRFNAMPNLPTLAANSIGFPNIQDASIWIRPTQGQRVIAFDGQLQPDLKKMIERGDTQSMLIRYAPDALIATDSDRISADDLIHGPWAALDYHIDNETGVFVRNALIGEFVDHAANVSFGPDIKLVGYAVDQTSLKPGQMMRVRLDWQFTHAANRPVQIDLRLASGDFLRGHITDNYEPGIFLAGPWSTYHTLTANTQAWPGPVDLEVGVLVNGSPIKHDAVGQLTIQPEQ
jgi:hypothetical protein